MVLTARTCPDCHAKLTDDAVMCRSCGLVFNEPQVERVAKAARPKAMGWFGIVLLIVAVLASVIGFFSLSQATMGVGFIGLACIASIWARIAQAADYL